LSSSVTPSINRLEVDANLYLRIKKKKKKYHAT
jgi:hypothetical protein